MCRTDKVKIETLLHETTQRTHALLKRAADHYRISAPKIGILFDLRGRSAGQVRLPRRGRPVIRYNPQLLWENGERFLSRTVPHEVAHIIAHRLHGLHGLRIRPHGKEWQAVMRLFGADISRCHDYDTSRSVARRLTHYVYHCACREYDLTSIRHHRIMAGQTYYCRACGKTLEPGAKLKS